MPSQVWNRSTTEPTAGRPRSRSMAMCTGALIYVRHKDHDIGVLNRSITPAFAMAAFGRSNTPTERSGGYRTYLAAVRFDLLKFLALITLTL